MSDSQDPLQRFQDYWAYVSFCCSWRSLVHDALLKGAAVIGFEKRVPLTESNTSHNEVGHGALLGVSEVLSMSGQREVFMQVILNCSIAVCEGLLYVREGLCLPSLRDSAASLDMYCPDDEQCLRQLSFQPGLESVERPGPYCQEATTGNRLE